MRIISGSYKGILINPPKGLPVRPTTDRAKESLFNIIENNFTISNITVLDLFSGTGNISYEFVSRGAAQVTAVDIDAKCVSFIKQTKDKHQFNSLNVQKSDAFGFIKRAATSYDIIFADAPYANKQISQIPFLIAEHKLLNNNGWLIVEHENLLDLAHINTFVNKRVYGQSCFSFFKPVD